MFRVDSIRDKMWSEFMAPAAETGKHLGVENRRQELALGLKTEGER